LYHIDLGIEDNTRNIVKKNKDLAGLREEQKVFDAEVDAARAQQAKTRAAVMQKEKNMKKTEKTLEGRVIMIFSQEIDGLLSSLSSEARTGRHRSPDCACYTQNEQRREIQRGCLKNQSTVAGEGDLITTRIGFR